MATLLRRSQVQWAAPTVLWSDFGLSSTIINVRKPVLLGFKSDTFMRDFLAMVQSNPQQIKDHIVKPGSFSTPPLGPPLGWLTPPLGHLKLYLPLHGCFYLILASLVNTLPGLPPDHLVNVTEQESARCVLRRLGAVGKEMAWVIDPSKAPPANKTWQELSADQQTQSVPNEALLPLFAVKYPDSAPIRTGNDAAASSSSQPVRKEKTAPGQKRSMLAGYVPTTSNETYQQAGAQEEPKLDPTALYVLRCIYFRPKYAQWIADVVSDPTEPFQIASVYDSDAPTRPSHVPTPPEVISATLDKLRQLLAGH